MSHNQLHIKYQLLQGTVSKLPSEMASKIKMRYFLTRFYLFVTGLIGCWFANLIYQFKFAQWWFCAILLHGLATLGVGLPAASLIEANV